MSQRQTADSTVLCAEIFAGSAMTAIKLINIINQLDYSLFRNILAQPAAEFSRKIILTVRKSTGTAKTAHDITRDTNAGNDPLFLQPADIDAVRLDCLPPA